jgi:hypothetical protein
VLAIARKPCAAVSVFEQPSRRSAALIVFSAIGRLSLRREEEILSLAGNLVEVVEDFTHLMNMYGASRSAAWTCGWSV